MASYKPRAKKDLTGQRFGALTVLHEGEPHIFPRGTTERTWVCKCDCGNEITATMSRLTGGLATSCGCKSKLGIITYNHCMVDHFCFFEFLSLACR